jgi:DNA primase
LTSDEVKLVKEANDIVDVVGGYVSLRPAGPTYKGLCPFHNDHRPSFDVDPRRQRYRCWSCGKFGDVLQFVQEHEKIPFVEALELLARRAGITLNTKASEAQRTRAQLLDVVKWAYEAYHHCFLDDPVAEPARAYLGGRGLLGPTVRRFGVGFAPVAGDWLIEQAQKSKVSLQLLERVGLVARRSNGTGFYDRFRDRVLFPIRDPLGLPIAFGGRILPSSPLASRGPKYYNSAETPLFSKSEQLYGLDQARSPGAIAGFLAVVEGYTDVLMAHQKGIGEVVATMGTALTARHVQHLRRFVPRVVLVFDADAGGDTGVDRALEIFASQEVDLAVATLPQGLDPCDLLIQDDGPERFRAILAGAVDALDFKLQRLLADPAAAGVEGRRRAVDAVLRVIALASELPGQAGAVKRELIVSRISGRLALKEETIWARLDELRRQRRPAEDRPATPAAEPRQAPSVPEERELLEILLADPDLVPQAAAAIRPEDLSHPGLRQLLAGLYALHLEGQAATLDLLRAQLDNPRLVQWALKHQEVGRLHADRPAWLRQVLAAFRQRRSEAQTRDIQSQLHAAQDEAYALDLLRRLQDRNLGLEL